MDIIKIDPENLRSSSYGIRKAAEAIWRGGAVVVPTDTVYGLVTMATDERAVTRLFNIKNRPSDRPIPVFVRDIEMAKKVACIDKKLEKILSLVWPGSVTVLLRKKDKLPEKLTAGRETIGLRIPNYKLVNMLLAELPRPLTATSANISDQPSSTKIGEVLAQFRNQFLKPDLVLDAGDLKFNEPSTVLDMTSPKPKIIRIGATNPKKLLEILSI
ncbi:MAG: L-threonylcarbamoyladenylate synthase [Candidatus Portnoybacteria bacterium]|nr:L-threonylcarbamoyladenylate synthase [Candidatus Portnoybacteria bacterium]